MNFSKKDDRIKYLEDKFDNLIDVIGKNYGEPLMEELISRLNVTIDEFNDEMLNLFKALRDREKEREKYLSNIKNEKTVKKSSKNKKLTKWEEKFKELENSNKKKILNSFDEIKKIYIDLSKKYQSSKEKNFIPLK